MTKPLTHALPYMVGMVLGKWLSATQPGLASTTSATSMSSGSGPGQRHQQRLHQPLQLQLAPASVRPLASLFGLLATLVALAEVFLPYKWNNSHLPTRLMGALYAALFRFGWSLVLAYLVLSCRHRPDKRCSKAQDKTAARLVLTTRHGTIHTPQAARTAHPCATQRAHTPPHQQDSAATCMCASGGSLLNRFLSLPLFTHLSKLSFVAYLIHLPLMSVFVSQTRGLFAFSHMLVLHLALSYLVLTFILAFVLVHLIEFPFITFERYLFEMLLQQLLSKGSGRRTAINMEAGRAHKLQQLAPGLQHHSPHTPRRPSSQARRVDTEDLKRQHQELQTERC